MKRAKRRSNYSARIALIDRIALAGADQILGGLIGQTARRGEYERMVIDGIRADLAQRIRQDILSPRNRA